MTASDANWTIPPVEKTDDPNYYRTVEPCDYDPDLKERDCHHPVHAFGVKVPTRHLIDAETAEFALKHDWIA